MRYSPKSINDVRQILGAQPGDRTVEAEPNTGIFAKTVDEVLALREWPPGLVVTISREDHPEAVVKVSRSS